MQLRKLKYRNIYTSLLGIGMLLGGCNKYLDKAPSKSTAVEIKTVAQLDALLSDYTSFYQQANLSSIYSTDDNGLSLDLYNAYPSTSSLGILMVQYSLWDAQYVQNDATDVFWGNEWKKIFAANLVLSRLDDVTGNDTDKGFLRADAHFMRAYSYFQLANTYCLPYTEANKNEMGLPLKTSTSFEESVARASLADTYAFIESDLKEALKVTKPLIQNGVARHWRANIAAVNGFAARYYLNIGKYNDAATYADVALADNNRMVDYNVDMRYGTDKSIALDAGTPQQKTAIVKVPYTYDNSTVTDMLQWKELMYFRVLYNSRNFFIPGQSLLALYDQEHDLRYKYHMVQGYSYIMGFSKPSYNNPGYVFFASTMIPEGPTTGEMYLIKAESLARTGNWENGLTTVNTLRAKRMVPGSWVNLTAASQAEALKKILEERRRELPYSRRWLDIRRFNNNDDPNDDVELSRTFYNYNNANVQMNDGTKIYTLPKQSRRFAAPLPTADINSANGTLQQNTY